MSVHRPHLHLRIRPLSTLILAVGLTALLAGVAVAAPPNCDPSSTHPRCTGEPEAHPGLTCAEEYADLPGVAHHWNGRGAYPLELNPSVPSACIDLMNGLPITLSVSIADTNGKSLSYNVADSRPGDDCTPWESIDLTQAYVPFAHDLPAATVNACTPDSEGDFSDSDDALAVYMHASFRGKPSGAHVTVTLTADPIQEG